MLGLTLQYIQVAVAGKKEVPNRENNCLKTVVISSKMYFCNKMYSSKKQTLAQIFSIVQSRW